MCTCVCIYIYIYIHMYTVTLFLLLYINQSPARSTTPCPSTPARRPGPAFGLGVWARFGRRDGAVGNPHRARFSRFELFELSLFLKL